ncbi:peptidylprolyl isomerase [Limibacter armeniacum]|uniref:peptidylprolyl isomerase n=1 Tax=Limibacter armeniacum TaxID=466084 RepID=UPI002FE5669E
MAIINKIRQKSGIAVGVIGVGLALFLLGGDLLSPNSRILGRNKQVVGEIAGEEVSLEQFNQAVEAIRNRYPTPPSEDQMRSVRQFAWNEMIYDVAFGKEYEKLGLMVTNEELQDMIKGNNVDPRIASSFTDSTGTLNRKALNDYLSQLKQAGSNSPMYMQFAAFEQSLAPERERTKYTNLLTTTYFANSLEAKKEYEKQNTKAEVIFLNVPYYSVPDSAVSVSDSDLNGYYSEHKNEFERDASRGIEFVSFRVEASEEDKYALEQEMKELVQPFTQTNNDTVFVEANTEGASNFLNVNMTGLPAVMNPSELEEGKVYGPYFAANAYRLYKVLGISEDSVFSAKASHMLFKPKSDSKEDEAAAKDKAQEILKQVLQDPSKFEELAKTEGDATPATKSRGGDLQWFQEGRMVKEFDKAVFGAKGAGVVPKVVKTDFGYHVIKVTEPKTKKMFNLAVIEKNLGASDETINDAYVKAGRFAAENKSKDSFEKAAEAEGLFIEQALTLQKDANYINSITGSGVRNVIRWAFTEAEKGQVSEVFDLDDRFVVAVLLTERAKGVASLNEVKDDVRRAVLKEKKADEIIKKLSSMKGSLEEIKSAYGNGATVGIEDDLALSAASLSGVGFAPKTVGAIFGMKAGETSSPIKDENSVTMVKVKNIEAPMETADYTIYKKQLEQRKGSGASYKVLQAITDLAGVEDERYKFF